jgi:adenosylcobinamide-GDP ribazoletransferase
MRTLLRQELELFFGALSFFTRLPIPRRVGHSARQLHRASRYFPAAGLVVGLVGALLWGAASLFWPRPIAILLALTATLWITGALHEDGLADMADGFGGTWEKARVLEIMKDSRVGVFGVIALILTLLGRFAALLELPDAWIMAAFLAGHAVSRFCAAVLLFQMKYAREDALSKARPLTTGMTRSDLGVAAFTALLPCLLLPFWNLFWGLLLAAAVTFWLASFFQRKIGGYTGDCLGATQQAAELAFYLGLLAHLPGGT